MTKNKFKPSKWDLFKSLEQEAITQMIKDGQDCSCKECLCCMAKEWEEKKKLKNLCDSCEYKENLPGCMDDSTSIDDAADKVTSCGNHKNI